MNAAPALAHAVDFGLQGMETAAAEGLQDDLGEGEHALAADARKDDAVDAGIAVTETPRAAASQCGAPSPAKAGTR